MYFLISLFVGTTEIIFILFISILVFGADKLPDIAKGMGRGMSSMKNAASEIKDEISRGIKEDNSDLADEFNNEVRKVKDEFDNVSNTIKRDL
ncbi:MAG: twin-arginine translocase TatA/TatE family subunit [Flavobacteriaceae bacterium]|nr:twin-arginine translocase TatA/TatE family subunit [Flavobacteriaceae bacterium]|tara:strand:+ start:1182 stop:1460 length:279 start_codon:yes stop_codon:yes gene_type:complete